MIRKIWILAVALVASIFAFSLSHAVAQESGVRAVYTGTLEEQQSAAEHGKFTPLATQASTTTPVISFNPAAVSVASGSAQTITATFTVSGYTGSFTPTATLHYGLSYST